MDVLASRAPDDRRAIEASLLKALSSANADEDLRTRARAAEKFAQVLLELEQYLCETNLPAAVLECADLRRRSQMTTLLAAKLRCATIIGGAGSKHVHSVWQARELTFRSLIYTVGSKQTCGHCHGHPCGRFPLR